MHDKPDYKVKKQTEKQTKESIAHQCEEMSSLLLASNSFGWGGETNETISSADILRTKNWK